MVFKEWPLNPTTIPNQTKYNVINQLLLTQELKRALLSIASSIDIQGPKRQIALSKAILEVFTTDQ